MPAASGQPAPGEGAPSARPVRVIPHDLPDPLLIWPAPPDRGGVEGYLNAATSLGP